MKDSPEPSKTNEEKKKPRASLGDFYQRLKDKFFLYLDLFEKIVLEVFDDIQSVLVRVFGSSVGRMVLLMSSAWVGLVKRKKRNFLLDFVRAIIGIPVLVVFFSILICFVLIGGTLASIFGLRNIGQYSAREQLVAWLPLLVVFCALPFMINEFHTQRVTLIFVYILALVGLDILYGQCGIVTLGHAGFVLVGSYMTTFFYNGTFGFKLPFLFSVLLASLSAFVLGILMGAPSLRIKDNYLLIITFAFTLTVPKLLKSKYLIEYSGFREGGLGIIQPAVPEVMKWMSVVHWNYFFIGLCTIALISIAYNLMRHSQIGRSFRAIKCDSEMSMIMGIPVVRYKLLAFGLSAFYAGFSGGLMMLLTKYIGPDQYTIFDSVNYLVALIIGGVGSIVGAVLGGAYLAFETDMAKYFASWIRRGDDLMIAFQGVVLILIVLFLPRGLGGELTLRVKSMFISRPRRGAYHLAPPPDYDYLAQREQKITIKNEK